MSQCQKCQTPNQELHLFDWFATKEAEMICEACIINAGQELAKKEDIKCEECGKTVELMIDDEILWFRCPEQDDEMDHTDYGEYLTQPKEDE